VRRVTSFALKVMLQSKNERGVHRNGHSLPGVERAPSPDATLDSRHGHPPHAGALPDLRLGQTPGRAPITQLAAQSSELLAVPSIRFHVKGRAPDSGHEHHMFIVGLSWRLSRTHRAQNGSLSASAHA
jgi:hypothetical protein